MTDIQTILESMKTRMPSSTTAKTQFKCEKCHDNGWIEVDHETRTFAKCECQIAREAEERLERSGLAEVVQIQTFDRFKVTNNLQRQMLDLGQRYLADALAARNSTRRPWLYIGGNPGSGKTHICTAVCGELLKRNIGVRYMQWVDEARRLKAAVNDDDFEEYVSDYINVPFLYIDDLLKQKYASTPAFTEADIKVAFTLLNARYLMNKPTIITSEWNLIDQLLPADEGVFSRIYERCKGYTLNIERNPANNYRLGVTA